MYTVNVLDIGCHVQKKENANDEGGNDTKWQHSWKEKYIYVIVYNQNSTQYNIPCKLTICCLCTSYNVICVLYTIVSIQHH